MKRVISLLLASLIIFTSAPCAFAQNSPWRVALEQVVKESSQSSFLLMDASGDGIPELFCPYKGGVASYYYDGNGASLAVENANIPFDFVRKIIRMREKSTDKMIYIGQTMHAGKFLTYKMSFVNFAPVLEIIAEENLSTGDGTFKGSGANLAPCEDVSATVASYLEDYKSEHFTKSYISSNEMHTYPRTTSIKRLFGRYNVLSTISDNSFLFSTKQREEIKKAVGMGRFLSFDRISVLNDDYIFVEYYINNTPNNEKNLSYSKKYALISGDFELIKRYNEEYDLEAEYLWSLISPESKASNFNPEYEKTNTFRGIDDYVNYFSSLLSKSPELNENGKKELANFMEYAVNKCSRSMLDSKNNVFSVKKDDISIISQNAVNSMGQLTAVCDSKGIKQLRTAKTVPELVCEGLDFSKPVRIEFENGVAKSIGQASGIKIALSDDYSIYLNTSELLMLESEFDVFAIEFTKNEADYSIVFTDKSNQVAAEISMPVWFVVPATNTFSSVLASFDGGTEIRGGQFDPRFGTIEFSASRSGNYQVVEEDITINDIDSVSFSANEAIRFLVAKGILNVDNKNNFYPKQEMSRYDFTKALVRMFYSVDDNAVCSYADVSEKSSYYPFVATAEKMGITKPLKDEIFGGDTAVTNEYFLFLCGKILAEKKGYKFPDNYAEYLAFSDKDDITPTTMPYIAVAVQCGLTENFGSFSPAKAVTREEGAVFLYKTFTLLYDTSPVTTSFSAVVDEEQNTNVLHDLTPIQRAVICVAFTAVLALGFFFIYKKRKQK